MTPKERAEKSAAAMWDSDKASKWVGMAITNVDEGVATLELQVKDHHCNGHGICHGGVIFTLADTALRRRVNSPWPQNALGRGRGGGAQGPQWATSSRKLWPGGPKL